MNGFMRSANHRRLMVAIQSLILIFEMYVLWGYAIRVRSTTSLSAFLKEVIQRVPDSAILVNLSTYPDVTITNLWSRDSDFDESAESVEFSESFYEALLSMQHVSKTVESFHDPAWVYLPFPIDDLLRDPPRLVIVRGEKRIVLSEMDDVMMDENTVLMWLS